MLEEGGRVMETGREAEERGRMLICFGCVCVGRGKG